TALTLEAVVVADHFPNNNNITTNCLLIITEHPLLWDQCRGITIIWIFVIISEGDVEGDLEAEVDDSVTVSRAAHLSIEISATNQNSIGMLPLVAAEVLLLRSTSEIRRSAVLVLVASCETRRSEMGLVPVRGDHETDLFATALIIIMRETVLNSLDHYRSPERE
ncbi:MAG: hypothetical protein ACKPB4_06685, partial [Sphaerospermopsis kisseleviana]